MTNRTRNLSILGIVLLLAGGAAVRDRSTKSTKLGLDLKGGIELVYQGQPTPQVPVVTPQALDDALETIRKRTDALGVSEPEIQRSGRDQISIGLPAVQNAERAIEQVGSTAQLQFYDWEPNVLGRTGRTCHSPARRRSTTPPSSRRSRSRRPRRPTCRRALTSRRQQADKQNDSSATRPLLPVRARPLSDRPRRQAAARGRVRAVDELQEPAGRLRAGAAARRTKYAKGTAVPARARGARLGRPARRLDGVQGAARHRGRRGASRRRTSPRACTASS